MSSVEQQIMDILKCPICYNIPRKTPIQSCEAGHIVCEDCRPQLITCPACRGPFVDTASSVISNIVCIVDHPCKYNTFGCSIKLKAGEIGHHEKECPERTVKCCFRGDYESISCNAQ